jgi:DNA-binding XRE family transcriptional regulator
MEQHTIDDYEKWQHELKSRRKELRLPQWKIAKYVKISNGTYSTIETGRRKATPHIQSRIEKVLQHYGSPGHH